MGSNPAGRKKILARVTFCPDSTTRDKSQGLLSRRPNPGSKIGTNSPLEPGQIAESVVVSLIHLMFVQVFLLQFGGKESEKQIVPTSMKMNDRPAG